MTRPAYANLLPGMRADVVKAEAIAPKKLRGYAVDQLRDNLARFEFYATCSEAEFHGPNGPAWARRSAP